MIAEDRGFFDAVLLFLVTKEFWIASAIAALGSQVVWWAVNLTLRVKTLEKQVRGEGEGTRPIRA